MILKKLINEKFGNVNNFAKKHKISQQLASYYANTDTMHMRIQTIVKLAEMLNVELNKLIK